MLNRSVLVSHFNMLSSSPSAPPPLLSNSKMLRVDVVVFVVWELFILAFLVFSAVSLYFRNVRLAFILVSTTVLLLLCMKITKQVRLARKKKRRMLLPLSM